ncbi:MAG: universal stress protein [Gemmataceae bacterium]
MNVVQWQRILAATDFSPFGDKAVTYAHELAEKFGAELHVLHVVGDITEASSKHGIAGSFDADDVTDERRQWIGDILGETGSIRRFDAVQIGTDVAEKIATYAKTYDISLIVMASHGRSGLAHFWLGSVTEKVIRSVSCPVLVLRPREEEVAKKQAE